MSLAQLQPQLVVAVIIGKVYLTFIDATVVIVVVINVVVIAYAVVVVVVVAPVDVF